MHKWLILGVLPALALTTARPASAGKIVLNNDEWTLSDLGFRRVPETFRFVENVTAWFAGSGPGNFHAFSTNFGLTEGELAAAMANAGHTYTTGFGIDFDLPTLQTFDGIFLAGGDGFGVSTDVLIDYVMAGGNVYLAAGTGQLGGSIGESEFWNPFLNAFGLGITRQYNGIFGNIPITSTHPIFDGPGGVVTQLYQANGSNTVDIAPLDDQGRVLVPPGSGGRGLYAVFESQPSGGGGGGGGGGPGGGGGGTPVPAPPTALLLLTGLAAWAAALAAAA